MTASDYPHRTADDNRVGLHYRLFWLIWLASPFAIQPLARAKFLQPGLNPRSGANAGAGTVYLQGPGRETGELIADNNNLVSVTQSTPILPSPSGLLDLTNLRVRRAATMRIDDQTNLTGTLEVASGGELTPVGRVIASTINAHTSGTITQLPTTGTAFFKVDLSANTLTVDGTSRIDVTGRGFLGGFQPGNPFGRTGMTAGFQAGSTGRSGGSYGGLGGASDGTPNPVYAGFRDPTDPGSGGGVHPAVGTRAGNGGGLIRIVAQTAQLDGSIITNGGDAELDTGGGSGGGIRIDVGTFRGTGQITANGGRGQRGAGGGGGRVAIYYQDAPGFDFTKVTAFGGSDPAGHPNGGAGTVYLQGAGRESGELVVDNNNLTSMSQSTPIPPSPSDLLALTNLRVRRAAKVKVEDQLNLTSALEVSFGGEFIPVRRVIASTIGVNNGAVITQLPTTGTAFFKVDLSANTLTVDGTSRIDVTGRGFLGGFQPGNPFGRTGMTVGFQAGSTGRSGGSYGGLGGASDGGGPNPVYGDFGNPNEPGSGGGSLGSQAGNGGGLLRVVAQSLQLDGSIVANGGDGEFDSGGGSGGGIRIDVGTLRGAGQIRANGGNGSRGSGGGGGRVAIYYQKAVGFDLSKVTAFGGVGTSGHPNGQNGTVFTQQQIAMRDIMPNEMPVMTAESEPMQLASLALPTVEYRPEARRMANLEQVRKEVEASLPVYPQYANRYLELEKERAARETDSDPIYTYDLNGNRTSMIDPTGITSYTYDALNRLTSVTNNRGLTTSFTYDSLGRRTSIAHGNGVVTTYQYDAASQLTRLAHQLGAATINSFDYTYDRVGNRTSKMSRDGVHNYTYDTLNRLIEAINPLPTNPLETYRYDAVGNRTNSNQNGSSTFTSVFNAANQLTEDGNFTYQYDANGNQTRKTNKTTGEITQFEYTAENQLVRVVKNGTAINYRYDGLGRRVEKEVNDGATTKVARFIYDNEDILLELDGQNNITARYTHGPGIDEPLIMEKSSASFFYHADGLGSITEITNQSGSVVQSYTYSSFGKIESQLDPNFIQPYTFTGREFDPETGLYFYRARSYDTSSGRFLSEDPIWLLGSEPNGYRYVFNNPLNRTDPSGLWALVDDIIFTAGGALVGVVGQGLGDLLYGTRGNWQDYVGAAFGGAVGGELLLYTGPVVAAAGGAASANFTKQSLNIISGRQCGYDALSYLVDTGIGTVTGMFKGLGIPGISAGRNSFNAIYNQMATKLQTGQISKVRPQTGFKMFVGRFEATGGVPGSGAAVGGSGLGNLLSFDTCPCQ